MSEIVPYVVSGAIGSLSGFLGATLAYKLAKKDIKKTAEEWINSEKGREAIYSIGILLGNAIMQGSGFGKPAKGNGGLKGMIMQGIAAFIQGRMTQGQPTGEQNPNFPQA